MKRSNFRCRSTAFLLSLGSLLIQPAVYAAGTEQQVPEPAAIVATEKPLNLAQASDPSPTGTMKVRATQQIGEPDAPALRGSVTDSVENLTRAILRDEVALQRFNLQFRSNAAKQGRWKGWRYFFSQQGNLAATDAGVITTVAERFGGHIHGAKAIKSASRNINANGGIIPGAVGQATGGAGSLLEFGINQWHSKQARDKGFGFKDARDKAIKMVAEIDRKMAEREALIKQQPAADKELADMQELEGKVLADFRDMAIAEFERYHVGARKTLAQQNSFYLMDAGLNKTEGVIAGLIAIQDILDGRPGLDISVGIFQGTSGLFIILNPILSRLYGKHIEHVAKRDLERHGLPTIYENSDKLATDWGRMQSFCKNHQLAERADCATLTCRLAAFDSNHKFVTDELQRNAKAIRRGNRTAIQNMGMATIIGGTKLAFGILAIDSGANYLHDNIRRYTLFSAANLQYMPALSLGVMDNFRIQIGNEVRRSKQQKAGTLPGQLIKQRLQELDKVEKTI